MEHQLIDRAVKVPKDIDEVYEGLYKMVEASMESLSDGWQPLSDIPAMVMAAISHLGKALEGIENLDEEWQLHPEEFMASSSLFISRLVGLLMEQRSKKPAED